MTKKDAIKRLNCCKPPEAMQGEAHEAFEMAIEALEKQIPKKPKTEPFYGGKCPVCNSLIPNKNVLYCSGCGQKLDWGVK